MINAYAVQAIRAAEQAAFARLATAGLSPDTLMQTAAAGLATACVTELREQGGCYGRVVLMIIGTGDNGGDALWAGVRLVRRGIRVLVCVVGAEVHHDGWSALLAAGGRTVAVDEARRLITDGGLGLVVDAVLGIGGRPGLREPAAGLARACRDAGTTVIAVDLPSGLGADGCAVADETFVATRTVTFGARKPCHLLEPARSVCGTVDLIDLGLDLPAPTLLQWELADLRAVWPVPGTRSDKYARGVVALDTGSDAYPGAGVLSTIGAVHAGAGMVRFVGAERPAELISARLPNVVRTAGRVQATLLGSGWGRRSDGDVTVASTLATGLPVVIDADGLRHLSRDGVGGHGDRVLLTPHAGELARLIGVDRAQVEADPVGSIFTAVDRTRATVLLKGATQLVAGPGSPTVHLALPGPAWTAQAGSGDTLAGICVTLLGAGLSARDAGLAAASIQALAAARLPGPVPPQELAESLAAVGRLHGLWS